MLLTLVSFLLLLLPVGAQNNSSTAEFDIDPYLQYRPPFARSLPVQILLTGIVLTLVAVLFIHLIFTAQYHWPLAPVNYVLQLSGVTTLLISLIATLHVVLSATLAESEKWPYMLSYIAVNVPPLDLDLEYDGWSIAERATWLVMNASTSGLIQITHIQFLTLLYPSRLEGRLIFALLGPLAIVAAVMQLLPINGSPSVVLIASAVRNVCNATLSLLFTAALLIWGLLVNRKQAWRTDGGTAAFGCAAVLLALVSTALNFLYVPREEEYVWLPSLMWAVILWQSFLGWWWWVGAGSGAGLAGDDLEERLKRRAKRQSKKQEARERRRETRQKAKNVFKGVTGAFTRDHAKAQTPSTVRKLETITSRTEPSPTLPPLSPTTSSTPSFAAFSGSSIATTHNLPRLLPAILRRWYASLRYAHIAAARQQAVERAERIRELDRDGVANLQTGWGLGSFGWRLRRDTLPESRNPDSESRERTVWTMSQLTVVDQQSRMPDEQGNRKTQDIPRTAHPVENTPSPSIWWWGPLARWRLQDSTTYR